jgi:hypothetical protein
MKEYYIILNDKQKGPLTKEEIIEMDLDRKTPIWYEGINDWTVLADLKQFKKKLKTEPPVFKQKAKKVKSDIKSGKTKTANEFIKIFKLFKYSFLIGLAAFLFFSIKNKAFSYLFDIDKIYWSDAREVLGYIPSAFNKTSSGGGYVSFSISDTDYGEVKSNVVSELFTEAFLNAMIILLIAFAVILFLHYVIYFVKWTIKHSNK